MGIWIPTEEGEMNLLTLKEAALILRVHPRTAYRWVAAGKMPGATKFRGVWRIEREILISWIKANQQAV